MSDAVLNVSHILTLIRQLLLLFYPYFADEELEAQRASLICLELPL